MTDLAIRQLDMLFSEFVNSFELILSGILAIRVLRWMVLFSAPAEAWATSTASNNVGIWRHLEFQLQLCYFSYLGSSRSNPGQKNMSENVNLITKTSKTIKNWENKNSQKKLRKLQFWSIFTSEIFNFPMLTHVFGGSRGLIQSFLY